MTHTKLQGIVPPLITPLTEDGDIDEKGLKNLLEHLISGGVHGIFILGTTGEGPALGMNLQKKMIRATMDIVGTRLPVLAGISAAAMNDSLEIADFAFRSGVAGAVCAPPYYFQPGDAEIIDYYTMLTKAISLPLYVYNMPSMTKIALSPAQVLRLSEIPGIVGYKDSSGNMTELHEIIQGITGRTDFSIFVGPEELIGEAVLFGADGGVPGGANLNPQLFVRMYEAAKAENIGNVKKLQLEIYRQRRLYRLGHYQSSIIKGIKAALSEHGICGDGMAKPFLSFRQPERDHVREILRELDMVVSTVPHKSGIA